VKSSLVRYRIGLGVIALLTLIVFVLVLDLASAHKQDAQTQRTANSIADKLDNYINDKEKVPASLAEAGVKNLPSNMTYRKKTADVFEFCITYKSSNKSPGTVGTIQNVLMNGSLDEGGYYSGASDLEINPVYHKGKNCQTIDTRLSSIASTSTTTQATQPVQTPYVKNADGSYTVCGVNTNYFETEGPITRAATPPSSSISLNATSAPYVGAYELVLISPSSQIFDNSCKTLAAADLHVGDNVDVFNITSPTTSAVSIILKRAD
jgi:hypothetical protein